MTAVYRRDSTELSVQHCSPLTYSMHTEYVLCETPVKTQVEL